MPLRECRLYFFNVLPDAASTTLTASSQSHIDYADLLCQFVGQARHAVLQPCHHTQLLVLHSCRVTTHPIDLLLQPLQLLLHRGQLLFANVYLLLQVLLPRDRQHTTSATTLLLQRLLLLAA
jgi:hypothetical protein